MKVNFSAGPVTGMSIQGDVDSAKVNFGRAC
jgi:hypothetical protein